MSKFLLPALAGVSAIAIANASAAAENITIYALRQPLPINQIASSVTVITEDDIARENKPTVTELLREVPGLAVANNGGVGQLTYVFMRGAESRHVLVVMDGMIMNDPSDTQNAFDFSNLTTDNIERIEILRGSQSAIYGSQAIGGVINIITKKGQGKPLYNALVEVGSFLSRKESLGGSGEIGKTSYSFSLANTHTNGISSLDKKSGGREADGADSYTLSNRIDSRLTDNFTARLNWRYNRNEAQFDSPGSQLTPARPDDDPLPENDTRQFSARGAGQLKLIGGKWTQELGLSYLRVNRDAITEYADSMFNYYFGRRTYTGWRETVDWVHHVTLIPNHALAMGAEASTEYYKSTSANVYTPVANVDNRAVFIEDQFTPTADIFVNASARVDDHQSFGRQYTWKIAPGYRVSKTGTTLKSSYGTGFKAPSLSQLLDPATGNANLQPEKSRGWDFGFEQPFWQDKATFGATWFDNITNNTFSYSNTPPFPTINSGKTRARGVENSLTLRPAPDWTWVATYTFTQADNKVSNTQLLRRPRHQANLKATYQYNPQWDFGADLRYVGNTRDFMLVSPFANIDNPPFTTLNLNGNYTYTDTVTLYGRIDNLFDKHYQEVNGYGQAGLSAVVGAKTRF